MRNYTKMKKTLFSSITENKVLQFDYVSKQAEVTKRKVYPLCLFLYKEQVYLSAFCLLRSEYRTFLIEKLGNCKKENQLFERNELLNTDEVLKKTRFIFDEIEILSEVTEQEIMSEMKDESRLINYFETEIFNAKNIFRFLKQQIEFGQCDLKKTFFGLHQLNKVFTMLKKDSDTKNSIENMFIREDKETNFGHVFKSVSIKVYDYIATKDREYIRILKREKKLKEQKLKCEERLRRELDVPISRKEYGRISKAA